MVMFSSTISGCGASSAVREAQNIFIQWHNIEDRLIFNPAAKGRLRGCPH